MSLKKTSLIVLLLLLAFFAVNATSNMWLMVQSNRSLDNVNKEIQVVLSIIDPINHSRTMRVQVMEYMHLLENGNLTSAAERLEGIKAVMAKADDSFRAFSEAPKLKNEHASVALYVEAWQNYRNQALVPLLAAAQSNSAAQFNALIPQIASYDRQFEIQLDNVLAIHQDYARTLNAEAKSNFRFGIGAIFTFVALFLLVIAGVQLLMKRYVFNPIQQIGEQCQQIAAGQLDRPIVTHARSHNELDRLQDSMEQMRQSLVRIIGQVRDSSQTVAQASRDIASGNIDLASRTEQQAAALTETAASMEQVSATVKNNTDNVAQASHLTREAVKNAREGEKVAQEVIGTMDRITTNSRKIEDITSVINGIAFQTNILALNAAVEAARAGTQGRGFAVVASEVRSLAQRSAVAAKEIEGLITESVKNVHSGSQQVQRTGAAITEIINSVNKVNGLMEHISVASDEQSRGIMQIEQAVNEMDSVTQQNAALVQQSASAAASLEEQTHTMTQAVSAFRLP